MSRSSVRFLIEKKAKSTLAEALALGAHFALYFGLLFSVLEPLQVVLYFCRDHAIAYHETSVLQSYQEILQHLLRGAARRSAKQEKRGEIPARSLYEG